MMRVIVLTDFWKIILSVALSTDTVVALLTAVLFGVSSFGSQGIAVGEWVFGCWVFIVIKFEAINVLSLQTHNNLIILWNG